MNLTWHLSRFDDLKPIELYAVLHLRTEVFVIEQNCAFQDMDYSDPQAWHLRGLDASGQLQAYSRLFAPGIKYAEASIGRVMSHLSARRTGVGRQLMRESIAQCHSLFPAQPIRIGAQARLQRFYESFGFQVASPIYLEDGIDHVEMTLL
jgi:ElaA protein